MTDEEDESPAFEADRRSVLQTLAGLGVPLGVGSGFGTAAGAPDDGPGHWGLNRVTTHEVDYRYINSEWTAETNQGEVPQFDRAFFDVLAPEAMSVTSRTNLELLNVRRNDFGNPDLEDAAAGSWQYTFLLSVASVARVNSTQTGSRVFAKTGTNRDYTYRLFEDYTVRVPDGNPQDDTALSVRRDEEYMGMTDPMDVVENTSSGSHTATGNGTTKEIWPISNDGPIGDEGFGDSYVPDENVLVDAKRVEQDREEAQLALSNAKAGFGLALTAAGFVLSGGTVALAFAAIGAAMAAWDYTMNLFAAIEEGGEQPLPRDEGYEFSRPQSPMLAPFDSKKEVRGPVAYSYVVFDVYASPGDTSRFTVSNTIRNRLKTGALAGKTDLGRLQDLSWTVDLAPPAGDDEAAAVEAIELAGATSPRESAKDRFFSAQHLDESPQPVVTLPEGTPTEGKSFRVDAHQSKGNVTSRGDWTCNWYLHAGDSVTEQSEIDADPEQTGSGLEWDLSIDGAGAYTLVLEIDNGAASAWTKRLIVVGEAIESSVRVPTAVPMAGAPVSLALDAVNVSTRQIDDANTDLVIDGPGSETPVTVSSLDWDDVVPDRHRVSYGVSAKVRASTEQTLTEPGEYTATLTITTTDGTTHENQTTFTVAESTTLAVSDSTSGPTHYEFEVDGSLARKPGTTNPANDGVTGSTATGRVLDGRDEYVYTGSVVWFQADGGVVLERDGSPVDPGEVVARHTLTLADPGEGRDDYSLEVGRALEKSDALGATTYGPNDEVTDTTATGYVQRNRDSYTFTGDLVGLSAEGLVAYLDGSEVDPANYDGDEPTGVIEDFESGDRAAWTVHQPDGDGARTVEVSDATPYEGTYSLACAGDALTYAVSTGADLPYPTQGDTFELFTQFPARDGGGEHAFGFGWAAQTARFEDGYEVEIVGSKVDLYRREGGERTQLDGSFLCGRHADQYVRWTVDWGRPAITVAAYVDGEKRLAFSVEDDTYDDGGIVCAAGGGADSTAYYDAWRYTESESPLRSATVTGSLVDATGDPVTTGELSVGSPCSSSNPADTRIGDDGTFEVDLVAGFEYPLSYHQLTPAYGDDDVSVPADDSVPDTEPRATTVSPDSSVDLGTIQLPEAHPVEVTVETEGGEDVTGAADLWIEKRGDDWSHSVELLHNPVELAGTWEIAAEYGDESPTQRVTVEDPASVTLVVAGDGPESDDGVIDDFEGDSLAWALGERGATGGAEYALTTERAHEGSQSLRYEGDRKRVLVSDGTLPTPTRGDTFECHWYPGPGENGAVFGFGMQSTALDRGYEVKVRHGEWDEHAATVVLRSRTGGPRDTATLDRTDFDPSAHSEQWLRWRFEWGDPTITVSAFDASGTRILTLRAEDTKYDAGRLALSGGAPAVNRSYFDAWRYVDRGDDGPSRETLDPVGETKPTDPDADGRFEDFDADGTVSFDDVITYYEHLDDRAVTDHPRAYDFDGDGRITTADVVALFEQL